MTSDGSGSSERLHVESEDVVVDLLPVELGIRLIISPT